MAVACPRRIGEVDGCLVPTTALFWGGIFGLKYFSVSICGYRPNFLRFRGYDSDKSIMLL